MKKTSILVWSIIILWISSANVSYAEGETITINKSGVNARSGPGLEYGVIMQLPAGKTYPIIEQKNDWVKIKANGREEAWVAEWLVTRDESQQKLKPPYATITASSIAVYSKPSFQGKKVAAAKKGENYKVVQEKNNWYQIQLSEKEKGWVPKWFTRSEVKAAAKSTKEKQRVTVLYDEVPLRKTTSLYSDSIKTVNQGDELTVTALNSDTYEIKRFWGRKAYIAGWLVQAAENTQQITRQGKQHDFTGKTIIIDPGHGGNDSGTIGYSGALEKDVTKETAQLLQRMLVASGANVVMTREGDEYQPLSSRVKLSNMNRADAFISIHYDSNEQRNLKGITPYYYHSFQKPLANAIYYSLQKESGLTIKDTRYGDYHVLRHNSQPSVLLELGYLSNKEEEQIVTSYSYQKSVVAAIYDGLGNYFTGGK